MKKSMIFSGLKNVVCCMTIVLPVILNVTTTKDFEMNDYNVAIISKTQDNQVEDTPLPSNGSVVLLNLSKNYCDAECILNQKIEFVDFMSDTFGIKKEHIYTSLNDINKDKDIIINNIGRLTNKNGELKNYSSFEKGLIEYLFTFAKNNPSLVDKTYKPYNGKSAYVEDLIKYFCNIYNDVDYNTAISIGAAESGYYRVKYMLNCNNIFGGMGQNGLIKYKNIEYGVLSFVRLLSTGYYEQGLTTVQSIGRKYCPVKDSNGNQIASPHWINLVNTAKRHYQNSYEDITVEKLIETKSTI